MGDGGKGGEGKEGRGGILPDQSKYGCYGPVYPTFGKVGVQKIVFARSARESCMYPHLKIRGAAYAWVFSVNSDNARSASENGK